MAKMLISRTKMKSAPDTRFFKSCVNISEYMRKMKYTTEPGKSLNLLFFIFFSILIYYLAVLYGTSTSRDTFSSASDTDMPESLAS